jgi:hypothetical protein
MQYNQPYGVSDPNAPYINGNPSTGTMGSIPPAASIEYPQREIVGVIADARMTPINGDLNQLSKAIQSGQLFYADDQGTANSIQVITSPNIGGTFSKGFTIISKAANTNTGATTVTVNGAGIWNVVHTTDRSPLNSYDINAGQMIALCYDGANFQLVWSARIPGLPTYLLAPRSYYVDGANGSDAYDGQTAAFTSGLHGPFKTIQRACNEVPLFNLNGYSITINVADYGAYASFALPQINGSGVILFIGNVSNPGACVIAGYQEVYAVGFNNVGGSVIIDGFKIQCTGASTGLKPCVGMLVNGGGTTVAIGNIEWGQVGGCHITTQRGGLISNRTPGCIWTITGSAIGTNGQSIPGSFLYAYVGGNYTGNSGGGPVINIPNAGIQFIGGAFVYATSNSYTELIYQALNGAGNVAGYRYNGNYNSSITTGGGGINYYPGSSAGSVQNGSYYT